MLLSPTCVPSVSSVLSPLNPRVFSGSHSSLPSSQGFWGRFKTPKSNNQMELREKQAQQMALSRQRLLTLAFDDMETIRMVSAHAPRSVPKAHILVLP